MQLLSLEAQVASARSELIGLEADIALAEAETQAAAAAILGKRAKLRDIEIDLARTDIKSAVDGVVVQKSVELGQTVAASLSAPVLFQIAQDLREIEIHANVDESDVDAQRFYQRHGFFGTEPGATERAFYFSQELRPVAIATRELDR